MTKLKPCPFCGGDAEPLNEDGHYFVSCIRCSAEGSHTSNSHITAIKRWNSRSIDASRRWIPVEERLPEDGVFVNAFGILHGQDCVFEAWIDNTWDENQWCVNGCTHECVSQITHWQPLPNPPK